MSDGSERALVRRARRAAQRSYAPYSHFPVGAAVLTDRGAIHEGCNVENASYGLTVCAERTAVGAAVVAGARRLAAVAVVAGHGEAARPCGACLQVLAEFSGPDLVVLLAPLEDSGPVERLTLRALLPQAFHWKPVAQGRPPGRRAVPPAAKPRLSGARRRGLPRP